MGSLRVREIRDKQREKRGAHREATRESPRSEGSGLADRRGRNGLRMEGYFDFDFIFYFFEFPY
jgi:hypothetical protein